MVIDIKRVLFCLSRFKQSQETDLDKLSESLKYAFEQVESIHKINSKL